MRSEICADLYYNFTVPKNWPTFFKAITRDESSIYLEHKSSPHTGKSLMRNREKLVDQATENSYNFSNYKNINSHKNFKDQS